MPGAGHTQLRRTILSRKITDGMEILRGGRCAEELVLLRERSALPYFLLDPDLTHSAVAPVGEQADAIAGRHDFFKMMFQLLHGEVYKDILAHLVSRLNGKRDFREDTQTAQVDHGPGEQPAVLVAGKS